MGLDTIMEYGEESWIYYCTRNVYSWICLGIAEAAAGAGYSERDGSRSIVRDGYGEEVVFCLDMVEAVYIVSI